MENTHTHTEQAETFADEAVKWTREARHAREAGFTATADRYRARADFWREQATRAGYDWSQ